jgi:LmbE family N-acetylglucosaminyl deacetylase
MLPFSHPDASLFIPDATPLPEALVRTTHLGIGAHQDDLEFMAYHGILSCYQKENAWFSGITCTNGHGSARNCSYALVSDSEMGKLRQKEQNRAAEIGNYGAMIQLMHSSNSIRGANKTPLVEDLVASLRATLPRVVYTHNLADKHETHLAVAIAVIQAIRLLPKEDQPSQLYGCEGWRDLDWLPDSQKIIHDVGGNEALAMSLNEVFRSQNLGGKRYDRGVMGRRHANATFLEPHVVDRSESVSFAMDMTPLIKEQSLDPIEYVDSLILNFRNEVHSKLRNQLL